ncbi:hypothetical protein ACWGJ2_05815 [Streptomyces sp. NPDC054796]
MTAAKRTSQKCPACKGSGEVAVRVTVGARRKRTTDHQQAGICLTCMGSGEKATE